MMTTLQARTPAIQCEGCANAIKRSLGRLKGVQAVDVDIDGKQVTVKYEDAEITEVDLRERLSLAGYPVE